MMNFSYLPEGMMTEQSATWTSSFDKLNQAMNLGVILEAPAILCDKDLNLIVDLGVMKGIIPREEAVLSMNGEAIKDVAIISRVGQMVCFKIIGFDYDEKGCTRAVLSRREAQYECLQSYLLKREVGDIINACVTHLEHFGAFVDIGCGISSLIPIDAISVSRISHPRERFEIGMAIKAVVTDVNPVTSRISLSHKELLGTWEENTENFEAGQTVVGKVRSIENYGVFVELTPNLSGLAEITDGVREGQKVSVYIKSILPDRMKIKLVILRNCAKSALQPECVTDYYVGTDLGHIDSWDYSPAECCRVIRSEFGPRDEARSA